MVILIKKDNKKDYIEVSDGIAEVFNHLNINCKGRAFYYFLGFNLKEYSNIAKASEKEIMEYLQIKTRKTFSKYVKELESKKLIKRLSENAYELLSVEDSLLESKEGN